MVKAPTVEDRNAVIALGLDVTEHATQRGIEVVLHGDADAQVLRDAGYSWDVRVSDLEALTKANRKADQAYAASVDESGLPSGRTSYRTYDDYLTDLDQLARDYPSLTRPLTLANETVLGGPIRGIEISRRRRHRQGRQADLPADGRPHAREWPSAEHTIEFAFDLLESRRAPATARARTLLSEFARHPGPRRQRRRLQDLAQRRPARRLRAPSTTR